LTQTCKPKAAGILLIIVGAGIPAFILLAMILVFLRSEIDPLTGEKTDTGVILFGSVLLLFALWILPIIGGNKAIKRKRWNLCLWTSIISLIYIPAIIPAFGILAINSSISLTSTFIYYVVAVIPLLAIPALVLIASSKQEFE